MKAILVVDMPKNCGDCPCACEEFDFCQADEKNRDCDWYKIPSWCPLRPLPRHKITEFNSASDYNFGYNDGWNECLDEILGETE